jgi:hypothetical protein
MIISLLTACGDGGDNNSDSKDSMVEAGLYLFYTDGLAGSEIYLP